jgi:electron transfer flavoprotein alpha subunit
MSGIYVVIEERDGHVSRASWEAVAAGQKLATLAGLPANAAVLGAQTESLATEVSSKALATVVRVEHTLLAAYTADGFTLALQQLIERESPAYVLFPHTYQVRDYAPKLASRLGQTLIGDVTAINDGPLFTRQLMQGRLNGSYRHSGNGPCFVSVQAGAFRADEAQAGAAQVTIFTPTISRPRFALAPASVSAARSRQWTWELRR